MASPSSNQNWAFVKAQLLRADILKKQGNHVNDNNDDSMQPSNNKIKHNFKTMHNPNQKGMDQIIYKE